MANHAYIHVSGLLARRIAYILCFATCIGVSAANRVFAAVEDSRFEFSPDGTNAVFEARGVSRREVLDRLFAGINIEIKWLNASFADEPISGTFAGNRAAVARVLLSQANFVIGYDDKGRLARVVIIGPAGKEPNGPALAALTAAIQSNGSRAPELPKAVPLDSKGAAPPVTPGAATARPMPTAGPPAVATPLPSTAFPVPDKTSGSAAAPTAPIGAPFTPAAPVGSAAR
jgi:hypothetical protein